MNERTIAAICLSLCLAACADDSDKDDEMNDRDPPSSWLVGDGGEMLRFTASGDVDTYPLDTDDDFRAIACVGHATAWVVGDAGTVLVSHDAGTTWQRVDAGTDADLYAVAAGEGHGPVWAVGRGGVVVESRNGVSWKQLDAPALDWTGVATDALAESTIASASDGSLWRIEDGALVPLRAGGHALDGVAMSPDGEHVAAVGAQGLVLMSHDGASSWQAVPVPTTRDLHAVRVSSAGDVVVAAGDAGVIVRVDAEGASAEEHLDPARSLRALHLRADGEGQAVGDAGAVLHSQDAGRSWEHVDVRSSRTLRGVDDFHFAPHL
jgi:photosystem II stability/assembly factor-like uncharacterized protein